MSNNYGSGVSRVLDPTATQYLLTLWQEGKPPCDAELNLLQDIATDWRKKIVLRGTPSGWLGNDTNNLSSYITSPTWSNWFQFGRQRSGESQAVCWAVVNGWVVPVTGTRTGTPPGSPDNVDTWNKIALDPPPANAGDTRIDFVFLEVWLARVPPNPSTLNKPAASAVYRYGNVEGGASFITDDIQDPSLGFETTERIQLQYRIRVAKGIVGLTSVPDGFDPTQVFGQGGAGAATSYTFSNMRQTLGDPGLWRAGDGNSANALATVDGYSYAIPITAVFRRNSSTWNGDPSPNLNGGFNRNPVAVDRTGVLTFSTVPTLGSLLSSSSTSATLASASNIPLPATPATPVLIKIGDEYMTYTAITGTTLGGLTRAQNGTRAEAHASGSTITVVSGRPDGLFSDQVASSDILDLRHVVNPNGFDYEALLSQNLDKLLRGSLRANWKRSGAGPQGTFVNYQDKISASTGALGVNTLDAPDGVRMIFSDAATMQIVETIIQPTGSSPPASVATTWSLEISANQTTRGLGNTPGTFGPGDIITFPVSSLKTGVSGGDADQIRWVYDSIQQAVTLRIDGQTDPVPLSLFNVVGSSSVGGTTPSTPGITAVTNSSGLFKVATALPHNLQTGQVVFISGVLGTPNANGVWTITVVNNTHFTLNSSTFAGSYTSGGTVNGPNLTPNDDLLLILGASFPATSNLVYVTLNAMYGAGRGLSRRPNMINNVTFLSPSADLLLDPVGAPSSNYQTHTGWAPLWSKYRNKQYLRNVPVTSPTYADLGAKAIIVQPFRRIVWPGNFTTMDGTAANVNTTGALVSSSTGATSGGTTFTDSSAPFSSGMVGDALQITSGPQPGRYTIKHFTSATQITLDRAVATGTSLSYTITGAQGLMPLLKNDGVTAKWTTTDPLGLFSGTTDGTASRKNVYVTMPRSLVPNWGEVDVPILHADTATFNEGINYLLLSNKGASPGTGSTNYVSYAASAGLTWACFTTTDFATPTPHPATYNGLIIVAGQPNFAGMRFFTDSRGLARKGLELPPFYGIARLFGIYESGDYKLNGSAFNGTDRTDRGSGATNLLRQDCSTPPFWIEIDSDGDSTFVINADAIDISRSTVNPISSFASGNYVIEASIFGFDRNAFDITQEFRLVLSRNRTQAINSGSDNSANIGITIAGPTSVLPGPATPTDSVLVNYTRAPYQGDPWGSQSNYTDIQQAVGPIQTAVAYQIDSTSLNESSLTRPNQKALEVLASVGFATTLGTGRYSGDTPINPNNLPSPGTLPMDFRNIGHEDMSVYPPTSPSQPRPNVLTGYFPSPPSIATDFLGASERLPLGALFRDKDFRGEPMFGGSALTLIKAEGEGVLFSNLTATSSFEQTEVPLSTASTTSGAAGPVVAQVDGEPTSYNLLVNYRVNRGGSAFTVSGPHPGGEVGCSQQQISSNSGAANVLEGRAYLVRNVPTSVGAQEVSAGSELMMLVVTTVQQLTDTSQHPAAVQISTNGSMEGYSAADLYRIEGHPILNNNVRIDTDPSTIVLSRRTA